MKIRNDVDLSILERFGYKYQENLIYPTYRRFIKQYNTKIIIEILVLDRTFFLNRNKNIKSTQLKYLEDLRYNNLIIIEDSDRIKDKLWLRGR